VLRTLQPQRLSDGVLSELLDAIRAGRLCQGERLPSERRLSEQLGVSRVSVREGLRMLELLEIIEVRQGKGAFVVSSDVRPSGRLLRHWLSAHRDEVLELLEVREALEATAAGLAAQRRARVDVPDAVDPDDLEALVRQDLEFHHTLARAIANPVLTSLIAELNRTLSESRFAMFAIPGRPQRSHSDHVAIAEAIRAGDADAARSAMQAHIAQTRTDVGSMPEQGAR
jgi:GntR family transcriptional regulator, transcriptional repressor for pyruvate dehydrogenase complex